MGLSLPLETSTIDRIELLPGPGSIISNLLPSGEISTCCALARVPKAVASAAIVGSAADTDTVQLKPIAEATSSVQNFMIPPYPAMTYCTSRHRLQGVLLAFVGRTGRRAQWPRFLLPNGRRTKRYGSA